MEGLDENIRIDGRIRSKYYIFYGDQLRFLIAKTGKGNSISLPYVKLEVNKRPIGNIKKCPLFRTLVKSLFGLDVTIPTKKVPSLTTKCLVLCGWVWEGFRSYGAKSRQAKDMPRVSYLVIYRWSKEWHLIRLYLQCFLKHYWVQKRKKSLIVTSATSLQNFLFTNTTQNFLLLSQIRKFCNNGQ